MRRQPNRDFDLSLSPTQAAAPAPSLYDGKGRLQLSVLGQLIMRFLELCVLFGPVALTGLLLQTPLNARCRKPWLDYLVRTLAKCGPVGIKWGQWASTRYDLFEDDVCEALGELTNQVSRVAGRDGPHGTDREGWGGT